MTGKVFDMMVDAVPFLLCIMLLLAFAAVAGFVGNASMLTRRPSGDGGVNR